MILLTSNGLSSQALIEETQKYLNSKMKKAAMVTTASVGYKEKDRNVPRLTAELESLGLTVTCIDIEFQPAELLACYDLILLIGGNPFYLLKQLREQNCGQILKKLAQDKIVVGVSAGSVVLQNSIKLIAQYSPEMNNGIELKQLNGLGLVSVEVLPHYSKFISRFKRFEERAQEYESAEHCRVIRIDDGQGVFIDRDRVYVV